MNVKIQYAMAINSTIAGYRKVLKYVSMALLFLSLEKCGFCQDYIPSFRPADGGPGAILVVNNNVVESVNLRTGSTVPIFTVPTSVTFVLNDLAVDPNRQMIYYVSDVYGTTEVDYWNCVTSSFGILTTGLTGVTTGGPLYPNISQSGACMANDGNLYIANMYMPANKPTRIYQVKLNAAGNGVLSAKDYFQFQNNSVNAPLKFGDFVIRKNALICSFNDGTYSTYNLPAPVTIPPTAPTTSNDTTAIYSQPATGWDGTVYMVQTWSGEIDKVTNVSTGATTNTGITLPIPNPPASNYKDAAGPVPANASIKGNLSCFPASTAVEVWYDVDQDGNLDATKDRLVTTTATDASGNYKVDSLIPDYYLIRIGGSLTYSTKNNYAAGPFINIGGTWVQNKTSGCSILPLQLNISAIQTQAGVLVKLAATDLFSADVFYEIEKSHDGIHFTVIDSVHTSDPTTPGGVSFVDGAAGGKSYYRARASSSGSGYLYSNIVEINYGARESISINQMPGQKSIRISLPKPLNKPLIATVINNVGSMVATASIAPGSAQALVELLSRPTGIYYVRLENADIHYTKEIWLR